MDHLSSCYSPIIIFAARSFFLRDMCVSFAIILRYRLKCNNSAEIAIRVSYRRCNDENTLTFDTDQRWSGVTVHTSHEYFEESRFFIDGVLTELVCGNSAVSGKATVYKYVIR